jgi:putative transposase
MRGEKRCYAFLQKKRCLIPAFCDWLQDNIEEALTVYDYPKSHRRRIRTSNGLERLNQEIKRRTRVARLFPNQESCLRLITAILVEQLETWISGRIKQ